MLVAAAATTGVSSTTVASRLSAAVVRAAATNVSSSIRRGLAPLARATAEPTAANTPSAAHTSATTRIADRNATTGNRSSRLRPPRRTSPPRRSSSTAPAATSPDQDLDPRRRVHERHDEQDDEGGDGEHVDQGGWHRGRLRPGPARVCRACEDGRVSGAGRALPAIGRRHGRRDGRAGRCCWSAGSAFRSLTTQEPDSPVQDRGLPAGRSGRRARPRRFDLVAPPTLPSGWRATSVDFNDQSPARAGTSACSPTGVGTSAWSRASGRCGTMVAAVRRPAARRAAPPCEVAGTAVGDVHRPRGRPRPGPAGRRRTTTLVVGHDVPRSAAGGLHRQPALSGSPRRSSRLPRARRRAASRAPSSHSWQIVASCSPRSHSASDSSSVGAAGLEPADHLDELLAGLLVAIGRSSVMACSSSTVRSARSGSVPVTVACDPAVGHPDAAARAPARDAGRPR